MFDLLSAASGGEVVGDEADPTPEKKSQSSLNTPTRMRLPTLLSPSAGTPNEGIAVHAITNKGASSASIECTGLLHVYVPATAPVGRLQLNIKATKLDGAEAGATACTIYIYRAYASLFFGADDSATARYFLD